MIEAMKFRIYPNAEQRELFAKTFGCARFVYNHFLEYKKRQFYDNGKRLHRFELIALLPQLKKENPWLAEVSNQALQSAILNMDRAFEMFFRTKAGYPKFKDRHSRQSFQIVCFVKVKDGKLFLPRLRHSGVKIILDRPIDGKIKTTTISRDPSGKYYASMNVETDREPTPLMRADPDTTIGIDLGINDFAVISTGERVPNHRFLRGSQDRLKRAQRTLARRKIGGRNRERQRVTVARINEKIANRRRDFAHKLSRRLACDGQVSAICVENLNVRGMQRSRPIAGAIADAGFSMFRELLRQKCERAGKPLIVISRFDPSSKTCGACGKINEELKRGAREWTCGCGAVHDRDLNAARNIRAFGLKQHFGEHNNPS